MLHLRTSLHWGSHQGPGREAGWGVCLDPLWKQQGSEEEMDCPASRGA